VTRDGATHVGVAFDHVIESFRNRLFDGYKTGQGVPAELMAQFDLAERAAHALGLTVWSMLEFEADDALATAAARFAAREELDAIVICTPDKDLAQCVSGSRVVRLDRSRGAVLDEVGVHARFGVGPASIPDWLALVGDAADGIPGVPRFGEKSASAVLGRYATIDAIPDDARAWQVEVRGAAALAASLVSHRREAALYKALATLRTDVPLAEDLADLEWRGARAKELFPLCTELGDPAFVDRVERYL
jgi:5'-3' exonuclease